MYIARTCASTDYYCISGNFQGRKLSWMGRKYNFCRENFRGMLAGATAKRYHTPNFVEKTFAKSYKTFKFAKVFSLESFPLYDIWVLLQFWLAAQTDAPFETFLPTVWIKPVPQCCTFPKYPLNSTISNLSWSRTLSKQWQMGSQQL